MIAAHRPDLSGVAAAPGVAVGPAFQLRARTVSVEATSVSNTAAELQRLNQARRTAREELEALHAATVSAVGAEEAAIFDAHLTFLDDPLIFEEIEALVEQERSNAPFALASVLDGYSAALAAADDPLFQARAADLQDIKQRLLRILSGETGGPAQPNVPSVILAHDLLPSQTVTLDRGNVLALCTAVGGATSHVAILARGLGLPAVVGLGEALLTLPDGVPLAVDGDLGAVYLSPPLELISAFRARSAADAQRRTVELASAQQPAATVDGVRLAVLANVSTPDEAAEALRYGAEGVGLLRTELLFVDRTSAPTEDEQLDLYRSIADALGRQPITIRTLDIGGDKPVDYIVQPPEANPALGTRGVRLAVSQPELLRTQLRAIWRIGPGYQVKVMFPMITSVEEVHWLRRLTEAARAELVAEGQPVLEKLEVGIMVEVPSAAVLAHQLAPLVDFFSIGTNDLTQYTLAVDRTNAAVSRLSDALHPAVIALIAQTAAAARAHGKATSVCGELAGEPLATALLLGVGVSSLSMTPALIPGAKTRLRTLSAAEAQQLAAHALTLPTAAEVRRVLAE